MKNVYELSSDDKSKFRKEFNKLSFTKDVNIVRGPALFIAMFGAFFMGVCDGLAEDGVISQSIVSLVDSITILSGMLFVALEVYLDIAFTRWMKIKHKVEY